MLNFTFLSLFFSKGFLMEFMLPITDRNAMHYLYLHCYDLVRFDANESYPISVSCPMQWQQCYES